MTHNSAPTVGDLCGVWLRRSLEWLDGRSGTTTPAIWIQGTQWFVDLRRPADGAVAFGLQAFAGRLVQSCSISAEFTWLHTIDWLPDSHPDVGRLSWDGDTLIEDGVLQPYREVWTRAERHRADDSATVLLRNDAGRDAVLLRSGSTFGFAVSRAADVDARSFDCEVSVGAITDGDWRIRTSTKVNTESTPLSVEFTRMQTQVTVTAPPARRCLLTGTWQVNSIIGDPVLLHTRGK